MVVRDRGGDLLHHHRLAGLGRRDDQRALAFALRRHQVEDAAGDVLGRAVAALEAELAAREQRREVLEQHLVLGRFQRLAVDGVDHGQREVALAVLREADAAGQVVAGAQVEAADLAGRDVGVVRAGQVAGLGRAQEAEAVRQDFQHAVGGDAFAVAGQDLEQGEDDVLLAGAGDAFVDLQLFGEVEQLRRRHALEVAERVLREAFGHLRVRARHEVLAIAAVVLHAATAEAVAAAAVAAVAEAVATVAATAALESRCSRLGVAAFAAGWPGLAARVSPRRRRFGRSRGRRCGRRRRSRSGRSRQPGAAAFGRAARGIRTRRRMRRFRPALLTRGLRTRFSAVSPVSGVLSDKQGILARRRALADGERDVRDVVIEKGCGVRTRAGCRRN